MTRPKPKLIEFVKIEGSQSHCGHTLFWNDIYDLTGRHVDRRITNWAGFEINDKHTAWVGAWSGAEERRKRLKAKGLI